MAGPRGNLDWRNPVLLYYQLKGIFRSWISPGNFDSGGRFPSESELQEQFGVSRMTIRRALSELVNEGFWVREQGRDSFVAQPRMQEQLGPLTSFTEEMHQRGLPTESNVLNFQAVVDEEVTQKMGIPADEELVRLRRVRLVQRESIVLQTNFVWHRFCPGLVEGGLVDGSLYKALEGRIWVTAWTGTSDLGSQVSIGLDGMMNSPTFIANNGHVLGQSIIWVD